MEEAFSLSRGQSQLCLLLVAVGLPGRLCCVVPWEELVQRSAQEKFLCRILPAHFFKSCNKESPLSVKNAERQKTPQEALGSDLTGSVTFFGRNPAVASHLGLAILHCLRGLGSGGRHGVSLLHWSSFIPLACLFHQDAQDHWIWG